MSNIPTLISVDAALEFMAAVKPRGAAQTVPLEDAIGRVCASDIHAAITHPPFNSSAMDGYAVKLADVADKGAKLVLIGQAPAGAPFDGELGSRQAVRIFTGSVVPSSADHVIIQENVTRDGDYIITEQAQTQARNIRFAGTDFKVGDIIKSAGSPITPIDATLIAGSNIADVSIMPRPIIAYFDNGDELKEPGSVLEPGQIIGSNRFAIDGLIREWGGQPLYLGRARDSLDAVTQAFDRAVDADVIVAIGGASVGDHDYVRAGFEACGGKMAFQKIAVKPGKPTWFGAIDHTHVLGLPGNPASAIVCAILFLRPLIHTLSGQIQSHDFVNARLSAPLSRNGPRENFLRARLSYDDEGYICVQPADSQDSSLMSRLSSSNGLIRCMPNMTALKKGDMVTCLPYGQI